ncbi:hypothetical protein UlMin_040271 [Ulmus minor]
MNFASAKDLSLHLISSAFQRCRVSEDLCRLSAILRVSQASDSPSARISMSDTGVGSCLEEFRDLKISMEAVSDEQWDGVLSVATTSVCDSEIYHYNFNLKERVSARRLIRLPSKPKNGVKFSGTEISMSIFGSVDVLVGEIKLFFQKMLILKIPNVAIELVVEHKDLPASRAECHFLANESNPLPFSASNLERLKSGLGDYVLKHGNILSKQCHSCFQSLENLKVGSGIAFRRESEKCTGMVMEVVITISEISGPGCSSVTNCSATTEVLYFKDYSHCPISPSSLKALTSIDWRSYGLTLGSVKEQVSNVIIEWEALPPHTHIDIVLHLYHEQYPMVMIPSTRLKTQLAHNLTKKAVKLALDDLRDKHAGVLLSAHALKIRTYAPDLAKSISGLILSSNDSVFQEECLSLLGLQSQGVEGETVEACIKEKIITAIEINDKKPHKSKDAAPFLFEDDSFQEPWLDEEHDGTDAFSPMDI